MNSAPQTARHANPAFIVGIPRSGTTLLASILNRHPEIAATPETHYFRLLEQLKNGWSEIAENWPNAAIDFINNLHHAYMLGVDAKDIILDFPKPVSPDILFTKICDIYANRNGKSRWIEKTPDHIHNLEKIRSYYPDGKIVHILRDGRDVALSLCKVPWASDGFFQNLHRWSLGLEESADFFSNDKNSMQVRYEDLLENPDALVSEICSFLGLDYHSSMLTPDGTEHKLIEQGRYWKENINKPIAKDNREKWKSSLSISMKNATDSLFGNQLARWGYISNPKPDGDSAYIAKSLLVSDYQYHTKPLPISDEFIEHLAKQDLRIKLTGDGYTESVNLPHTKFWITTESAIPLSWPKNLLLNIKRRIKQVENIKFIKNNIIIFWVEGSSISSSKCQRIRPNPYDLMLAKCAKFAVCTTKMGGNRFINYLHIPYERIVEVEESDISSTISRLIDTCTNHQLK